MKRLLTAVFAVLTLATLSSCATAPVEAYAIESSNLESGTAYSARVYAARYTENIGDDITANNYLAPTTESEEIAEILIDDNTYSSMTTAEKLERLELLFPAGSYWNCAETTGDSLKDYLTAVSYTPCDHSDDIYYCREYNGAFLDYFDYDTNIQCLGFAELLSDLLFGEDAPVTVFYDFDSLQVGDHIRLNDYEHSMIVTSISGTTIGVAECNEDYETCEIGWNRQVDISDIECYDYEYMGRR